MFPDPWQPQILQGQEIHKIVSFDHLGKVGVLQSTSVISVPNAGGQFVS